LTTTPFSGLAGALSANSLEVRMRSSVRAIWRALELGQRRRAGCGAPARYFIARSIFRTVELTCEKRPPRLRA
jgi:hypothetical protein